MENNREETEIESQFEQIDEDEHVQEEVQQEQEPQESAHTEVQIVQIEDEEEEENKTLVDEAIHEDVKTDEVFKEPKHEKEAISYPIPVTRLGFFLRGALAIALGAVMFLHQDDALRILGILLGCAIILMSGLNLIIGYRDRFKEFYGKWLIIAGVMGVILGIIAACVPLLISPFIFLFLTLALVILGCGDIVLAIYIKKIPEVRRTLVLLGLLSIVAGILIYIYPSNFIIFFCIYVIASGVLSIAISLFMKSDKKQIS